MISLPETLGMAPSHAGNESAERASRVGFKKGRKRYEVVMVSPSRVWRRADT